MGKMNRYQAAVAKTYGGGDYAHLIDADDWTTAIEDCGDTLFLFMMRELADDGEAMESGTAIGRMFQAECDVIAAIAALQIAGE